MAEPITMIAVTAIKNPKSTGKVIKGIFIGILSFVLLICTVFSKLLSFFDLNNIKSIKEDVTSSANYRTAAEYYNDYMNEVLYPGMEELQGRLYEQFNSERFRIEQENRNREAENRKREREAAAAIEEGLDPEPVQYLSYEAVPDEIQVTISKYGINPAYLMAYYTHATDDLINGTGSLDREVAYMFFDSITEIATTKIEDTEFRVYNALATPEEAAEIFFGSDSNKYELYLLSFEMYIGYVGYENISLTGLYGEYEVSVNLGYVPETGMPVPAYYQTDYKNKYGSGTIASSGCAPTCIAMVVSYLKREAITPPDVVKYTGDKYYVPGAGSSWGIFQACATNYNLKCSNLGRDLLKVMEELEAGHPVIASMAPGIFTSGGHFIVIRGSTADGYFLVNDPNKKNYTKYKTDKFEIIKVFSETKNFWSFY